MMSRTGRGSMTPAAKTGARRAISIVGFAAVLAALAGCGSGVDVARTLDNQEQIRQARADGATAERIKQLQRQLREQKGSGGSDAPGPSGDSPGGSGIPGTPGPLAGSRACGDGVTAGPNTTCAFARNVRDDYWRLGGGDISVSSYSSALGRDVTMSCHSGTTHTCTGGNNASVYFP
ncbi:MAG TPA: hypothetical protein VJT75_08945 [Thermoleophilaceae bacterium]|nr:hypothetical protein [Thermoleophilaceae bacterium]